MSTTIVNSDIKTNRQKLISSKEISEEMEVLKKITEIKKELDSTINVFDYVIEEELIDSCIYDINSLNRQYSYYIRLCKEKGFKEKPI